MSSEMCDLLDGSSYPTAEDILRRFHHSVHEHYETYAAVCMETMEHDDFSTLASVSDLVLAGNNCATDGKPTSLVENGASSSLKAQICF
jgi:hypothetical protein